MELRKSNEDEVSKRKERLRQNRQTQRSLNKLKGLTSIDKNTGDGNKGSKRKRKWGTLDASQTEVDPKKALVNKPYLNAPTDKLQKISQDSVPKGLGEGDKSVPSQSESVSSLTTNLSRHELVVSGRLPQE